MNHLLKPNTWLNRHLSRPGLSPEERVRIQLIRTWTVTTTICLTGTTVLAGILKLGLLVGFGGMFFLIFLLTTSLFSRLRNMEKVFFIFLLLLILNACFFTLALGGFSQSHGLIYVGFVSAMGAMALKQVKWTLVVFLVYFATILAAVLAEPFLTPPPDHPPSANLLFHVLHFLWMVGIVFLFIVHSIRQRNHFSQQRSEKRPELDQVKTEWYSQITRERNILLAVILQMVQQMANTPNPLGPLPPENTITAHREDAFIHQIRIVAEAHLSDESFGIPDICRELAMSRSQLYRKFKMLTKLPLAKFIRTIRLHKAKELLEQTHLNVTEVAIETGFRNLSHFSTAFKQEFGACPSAIRKETFSKKIKT